MTVRIRLSRYGAKKKPFYRIVVADVRSPRDGRFIEKVGTYDPLKNKSDKNRINLKMDRIKYWIESGAQPTDRVNKFLSTVGLTKYERTNNPLKSKPKKKAQERLKAKEELLKKKDEEKKAKEAANDLAEKEAKAPEEDKKSEAPVEKEAKAPEEDKKSEAPVEKEAKAPEEDKKPEALADKDEKKE